LELIEQSTSNKKVLTASNRILSLSVRFLNYTNSNQDSERACIFNIVKVVLKMKKFWPILATLLCLSGGVSQAQVCPTLTVTGPPSGAPASWLSEGKLIGAAVELVENMGYKAGAQKVVVRSFPTFAESLSAVYKGEVDVIFSAGFSEERERYLDYIRPSFASQFLYVIVRRGEAFDLQKFEDLSGRLGASAAGETYGDGAFGEFVRKELKLQRPTDLSKSIDMLLDNQVDFVFGFENAASSLILTRNLGTKLQILTTYPTRAETFIAFSKRSKCGAAMRQSFSEQVVLANNANTYRKLLKNYREVFNETMTRPK